MRPGLRLFAALMLGALVAPSLPAKENLQRWGGLQTGGLFQRGDNRGAMNGFAGGVAGGTWFNPRWGADVTVMASSIESKDTGLKGVQQYALGAALFNVYPDDPRWTPYVKAGLGVGRQDQVWSGTGETRTRAILQAGLGTQYNADNNLFYGLELRMVRYEATYHEWPVVFTAGFRF